jgi:two-component system heavy metal sensor histidine kinase CusS
MSLRSIQVRLTLWYSLVLILGLGLFGTAMWFALEHRLIADVDERLAQESQSIQEVLDAEREEHESAMKDEIVEFARELPEHTFIQVRNDANDVILSTSDQTPPVRFGPSGYQTADTGAIRFRVLNVVLKHHEKVYTTAIGASLEDVQEIMKDFRNLLLLMIPVILGFSTFGAYWMSRKALAPVDDITRAAKSITVENLSRRLVVPDTCDELQRMSEAWNEVLERLDVAVQRIAKFTADASHELRTPIAVISAAAELALRSDREPDQYKDALQIIRTEAARITELTESLLSLARMDFNTLDMPLAAVNMGQLVTELSRHLDPVAAEKRIAFTTGFPGNQVLVLGNHAWIRRLLLILLDNAIKYTQPGGTVGVDMRTANGKVFVMVRDSGPGIAPEDLPHIFERFYRADPARSLTEGSGLGLSIAKRIADQHQTRIEVETALGSGSSFNFALLEYREQSFR